MKNKIENKSLHVSDWVQQFKERKNQIAVRFKINNKWESLSWDQYLEKIVYFSQVLTNIKNDQKTAKIGNHIALLSNTCWEWSAFDLAIIGNRDITVPLYANQSDEDLLFILENCKPCIIVIENDINLKQINKVKKKLSFQIEVLQINKIEKIETQVTEKQTTSFLSNFKKIKDEDTVSIIYTSGTTGFPKGVVLQHQALVSEIVEGFALFDLFTVNGVQKTSLAFLPFAHVMGRIEHFGSCYAGYTLAFAGSVETLKNDLQEIKPDFLVAVPRIFEKIYSGIIAKVETQKLKKKLFDYTMNLAQQVAFHRSTKKTMNLSLILQYEVLSKLVFKPIKNAFGGNLKFAICGGAAMSEELTTIFNLMGIEILVGYGLTETFAAVTINTQKNNQPGTVGKPIGDVEIKFEADGEILIRSRKCMKEYFKNSEATKSTLSDGFLRTGDIGEMTPDGFLKITDRKKDLIKTSGGKYVAPQKLENLIKQNTLVSQVLIVGEQKKFISAIINIESQIITPEILNQVKNLIHSVNSKLASFESIKKFEVITDLWNTENGSLTPSMKLKKKYLEKKYTELISRIYD